MNRRVFMASLGGIGAVKLLSSTQKAEALEHYMVRELEEGGESVATTRQGRLMEREEELERMPAKPTLLDFYKLRWAPARHVLQSAGHAVRLDMGEETVMACLLHDVVLNLIRPDHGWWGAQLVEPYVSEKVSWAIRYHQALRFYPDPAVGYEYPEMYNRIFGEDYKPDPYIEAAYEYARNHKWYMEARKITMNDDYSFEEDVEVSTEPFVDIIGRQFKQPKEGLGYDNSPVAHMWRSMIDPKRRL
jgi:hypothetical protein